MGKHLNTCRKSRGAAGSIVAGVAEVPAKAVVKVQTFYVKVQDRDDPRYWMHLDVPKSLRLRDLDTYLREIWLECCGHLSAFSISGVRYEVGDVPSFDPFGPRPRNMHVKLYKVLRPGRTFSYEYDFGSTTTLALRVVSGGESELRFGIHLLARNDPPELVCHSCGSEPASVICADCISYEGYELVRGYLCIDCGGRHGCDQWMLLPVVNSPRTGMCGYVG
ncbi:MAG: hypothetical protein OXS29_05125 [bacterium]|nr:hypothetical protein [bacterium]MDE0289129.1 hypothetical protein [bacterium]MDE0440370.1 hypothetical protein [bacterium]